jgi:hypothetical protein
MRIGGMRIDRVEERVEEEKEGTSPVDSIDCNLCQSLYP